MAAWAVGGATTDGYSSVQDAISDLAAIGAPTRPLMTAGMVAFGLGVPVWATSLPRRAAVAGVLAGLGSLAVAALPLRPGEDVPAHAVAAGAAYVALVATPLLAGGRWSRVAAAVGAVCLVGSTLGPAHGLFQRAGLTAVDAWIVATALGRTRPTR